MKLIILFFVFVFALNCSTYLSARLTMGGVSMMQVLKFLIVFLGIFGFKTSICADNLVPQSIIDDFIKDYSADQLNKINKDLDVIKGISFDGKQTADEQPVYIATAGGPGSSKSTILEAYIKSFRNLVYVDPDQRSLRFMAHTYLQEFNSYTLSQRSYSEVQKHAYNYWRGASNYIANSLLNTACEDGYSVAHGTTSTGGVEPLYKGLKKRGYKIVLLLCVTTPENAQNAVVYTAKNNGFYQADPDDVINKGEKFYERFPTYFQYADEIVIYWIEKFSKGFIKAAEFSAKNGLIITDSTAYQKVLKQYEKRRKNKNLPVFNALTKIDAIACAKNPN
jgi:predicted ABC-type ATPase